MAEGELSATLGVVERIGGVSGRRGPAIWNRSLVRRVNSPFADAAVWFLAIVAGALVQVLPAVGIPVALVGGFVYYWIKRSSRDAQIRLDGILKNDVLSLLRIASGQGHSALRNIALWRPADGEYLALFQYISLQGLPAEGRAAVARDPLCSIWLAYESAKLYEEKAPPVRDGGRQRKESPSSRNDWSVRYAFPLCDVEDRIRVVGVVSFECGQVAGEEIAVKESVTGIAVSLRPALEPILSVLLVLDHDR